VPELPEVEVVRRDLEAEVTGQRVTAVTVTGVRSVRRQSPQEMARRLRGATFGPPRRLGKYLLLPLDGAEADTMLVVHLRMSGQLVLADPEEPEPRHTHAVLSLSGGRELRFVDPRTFGELFVAPAPGGRPAELTHLGPDPLDPDWSEERLAGLVLERRARLKLLLMDQRRLAGLGNIYTDEALFESGLRFDRPAGSLTPLEIGRLHRAITATLAAAVAHRGSSLRDAQYVDLFGRPGGYQAHHRVYGREGQPCPRCAGPVVRRRFGARSTFLCEGCQS
jgi:formamidopyrimidine-DNA glycosylase